MFNIHLPVIASANLQKTTFRTGILLFSVDPVIVLTQERFHSAGYDHYDR